ncbi:MAG TPA: hypothetical protein VFV87_13375, partial [Pirellulaceae bacterium]|nr:hypothetical protein [Pirellulaceae bacterium]
MGFAERRELYQKLEEARGGRPLIVYVTSTRPGVDSRILPDAVPQLLDQLDAIERPDEKDGVDLLVVSHGGDPMTAWRAMTLLHERVKHVAVLVPQVAYSAATMLAMGANDIVMHPNGNLGPVDPQIEIHPKPGEPPQRFGFEDLAGFLQFIKTEVGLTDQEQIQRMFAMFCNQVGPVPVAISARASLLTATMGEKLLMLHMGDREKAKRIAESLNKKFFNHGYPVSRREAKDEIGLQIKDVSKDVEKLMWEIWLDVEKELEVRKRFNPIFQVADNAEAASALFGPVLQGNAPVLPMQLMNDVQIAPGGGGGGGGGGNAASTARALLDAFTSKVKVVDVKLTTAIMESTRKG